MRLIVLDYGLQHYGKIWDLQKKLNEQRYHEEINDVLILVEHKPVYTLGKHAREGNILLPEAELQKRGIEVFHIDRGGDVTFHGPGQLVGYPIVNLRYFLKSVKWYVNQLEESIIRTLKRFGLEGQRRKGLTGVWIGKEKIAAIGIRIHRWVTMHGFALNVTTNLDYFSGIIPCGIRNAGVTSMKKIIGEVELPEVKRVYIEEFQQLFGYKDVHVRETDNQEEIEKVSHAP